jgi:hypothetical protein
MARKTTFMQFNILLASVCLPFWLLSCGNAVADEIDGPDPAAKELQIWLNAGMRSRHFEREKNFRENNSGFGAEVFFDRRNAAIAGYFINSDNRDSNYVGWAWRPLSYGPATVGLVAALFDGYPRVNGGGWFPAAFPVASFEYQSVGVNLILIPTVGDRLHGAFVAQLKLRIK